MSENKSTAAKQVRKVEEEEDIQNYDTAINLKINKTPKIMYKWAFELGSIDNKCSSRPLDYETSSLISSMNYI